MIPYVGNADEARAAVAAMRYPPRGIRGVAKMTRAAAFGQDFNAMFAHAHERLVTMVQIDTVEALEQVDAIAAVDGADVLFVGPLDLSVNLGICCEYSHPTFIAALTKVAAAAKRAGKAVGILALDPSNLTPWRELGYTVMALGSDGGAVNNALTGFANALKKR